ncbi:MAG: carboxypeptidase regulatory-like domain-containing protein, partial [Candidatus Riflebacteria bacterium]|nr:carboxypeptidase regulatory-like domain-containing protein [Candidatus Riflebacteria bacterium]
MTKRWITLLSVFFSGLLLFGCGNGSGGGNPVASNTAPATLADLSGTVSFQGVPMSNTAVYLIKSQNLVTAGLSQAASMRVAPDASTKAAATADSDFGDFRTMTDDNGAYRFSRIPIGEYNLVAVKDDQHQAINQSIKVGTVTTVDVVLTPTGSVKGSVSISGTSDLSSVMIYLEGTSYVAITGVNGAFRIAGIPIGNYTLSAVKPGFKSVSSTTVVVEAAVEKDVGVINMAAASNGSTTAASLSGHAYLTSAASNSSGITVSFDYTPWSGQTDASGSFNFVGIPLGIYTIRYRAYQFVEVAATIDLTMPGPHTAQDVVMRTISSTQANVAGNLIGKDASRYVQLLLLRDMGGGVFSTTPTMQSAIFDTSYSFVNIPTGTYKFDVQNGYALSAADMVPFTLSEGQNLAKDLTLTSALASVSITLTGVDPAKSGTLYLDIKDLTTGTFSQSRYFSFNSTSTSYTFGFIST